MMVKLRLVALLSSLCVLMTVGAVRAHEVQPSIADLAVTDGNLTLRLRANVEAFVAGVDLDGLEDTDASTESDRYDALRALPPDRLAGEVQRFAERWLPTLRIEAATPVPLALTGTEIPEIGDPDLARASILVLSGTVPEGTRSITLTWPAGAGALVLRQQGVADPYTAYLAGGETTPPIPLAGGAGQTALQAFLSYVPVGFDHILPKGLDHILFVLALFFLSTRLRTLLWQITAFTLAHTVTLALGALGWVQVPASIVEPLIAASIAFVAVENLFTATLHRWRPVVVFCFGLLHGLGFASVLEQFGLPPDQFIPALIGFNVGVELGQLTVIAIAFLSVGLWFGRKSWYRARIAMPASAAIACIGLYWVFERVFL